MSTNPTTVTMYSTELMDHVTPAAVLSVLIAIFGTVANSLSLSYFIKIIRSSSGTRNSDSSTTKLFAALNVLDLLVSVSCAFLFLYFSIFNHDLVVTWQIVGHVLLIPVLMTGFLTCLLAIVRAIHLILPFNRINWEIVCVSIAIHSSIVVFVVILSVSSDKTLIRQVCINILFLMLASVLLTVVSTSAVCLIKLSIWRSSHGETWKRKATKTVAILSVIYCLCNAGGIVIAGTSLYSRNTYSSIPLELEHISNFVLVPLNSACNPVVYLIRREDMRAHVRVLCGKVSSCFCRKGGQLDVLEPQTLNTN